MFLEVVKQNIISMLGSVPQKYPQKKLLIMFRLFFFANCLTKKKEKSCLTLQLE